jgi:hypothetical protein
MPRSNPSGASEMIKVLGILAFAGIWILSCETAYSVFPSLDPTPTRTVQSSPAFTDTAQPVITGQWQVFYSWGCGSYSQSEWILYAGGTFYCPDIDGSGTWTLLGRVFRLEFDYPPYATYTGELNAGGSSMEGTMADNRGRTGCWFADKESSGEPIGSIFSLIMA